MRLLIILFFIIFSAVQPSVKSFAQEAATEDENEFAPDQKAIDKVNSVVQKVFDDAMAAKEKYKELANLDEKCLTKNPAGFLTIAYETQVPAAGGKTTLYAFKLDVEPIKEKTYSSHDGAFSYPMPLLDLQFSGYMIKHPLRRQFDLTVVLDKVAQDMSDYQQQFMPLRFLIIPEKEIFKVGEPIRFKVVLANISKENMIVKGLSQETLFFTLNDNVWGTQQGEAQALSAKEIMRQESQRQRELRAQEREARRRQKQGITTIRGEVTQVGDKPILRSDEALTIDFIGDGYRRAQDVVIRGIYQLNIKGLKPTAKVTLKIEP